MKWRTKAGPAEGQELSDIQENNKRLKHITYVLWAFFIFIVTITAYIMYYNVLGNILKQGIC